MRRKKYKKDNSERYFLDQLSPENKRPKQALKLPQNQQNGVTQGKIEGFYASWEWKRLSYDIKIERGRKCECCGAAPPNVRIITDHIKPIRKNWNLRFDKSNLQVLCEDCNMGKGSRDETDFRGLL